MVIIYVLSLNKHNGTIIVVSDPESYSASLRMEDPVDHSEASVIKRRMVEKMASATGDSEESIRLMDTRYDHWVCVL